MLGRRIRCCLRFRSEREGADGVAGFQFLEALDDHLLAWLEPLRDDPLGADAFADSHRPDLYLVLRRDDGDLVAALQFAHSALGNQQGALTDRDGGADLRVLARAHHVPRVGKQRGDADRAGLHIHLPVREEEPPLVGIDLAVAEHHFDAGIFPRFRRIAFS